MEEDTIVIVPFDPANLSTSSYDVTLGDTFYREQEVQWKDFYNMYSEKDVKKVWGEPEKAVSVSEWTKLAKQPLVNIYHTDRIIWIKPRETILAHTNEFIGGRGKITTMMKARSSMGRNFLEICKCAGWGDVGFINRWTMEITNNSRHYAIPLVVGRRIAQIVFFETEGVISKEYGNSGSKYQSASDLTTLMRNWKPSDMLPRLYMDREVSAKREEPVMTPQPLRDYGADILDFEHIPYPKNWDIPSMTVSVASRYETDESIASEDDRTKMLFDFTERPKFLVQDPDPAYVLDPNPPLLSELYGEET
jgi:dCTP deaminase